MCSRQLNGTVAVAAVARGKGLLFCSLLAVDLDGPDSREILLNQVAEGGEFFLLRALLTHHAPTEQAHCAEHHGVEPDGGQGQPRIDGQHRGQRQRIGQQRVGQAENRESEQAPDVFHIAGGATDHFTAAFALNPIGFLAEHVLEQALTQIHLHLPTHAEDELSRGQPDHPHGAGEQHNPSRLAQDSGVTESLLQLVHNAAHFHRDRDPQNVDHHQGDGSQQHRAAVGTQIAADQIETKGGHASSWVPLAGQPRHPASTAGRWLVVIR